MKFVTRFLAMALLINYSVPAKAQFSSLFDTTTKYEYSKKRITPMVYYSNPDRIFVGLRFRLAKVSLRQDPEGYPIGFDHSIHLRYSISQNAFSTLYDGKFYQALGHWNVLINANYDWVIWTNFFGLGNETRRLPNGRMYYRLSTSEYAGNIGLNRIFADNHHVNILANIQGIEVLDKPATFVAENYVNDRAYYFEHHIYTSLRANYTYQNVDDVNIPEKGVMFYAGGGYTVNISEPEKNFASYNSILQLYIPLINKFSLSLRAGGSGISGDPEFYQYVSVGGPMTIRGYVRDRFWGNTAYYNTNELRYITNLRIKHTNSKIGVFALFDNGRVWMDHENSSMLHSAYGAGVLAAPLNKFTGMVSYAVSPEGGIVQLRVSKLLAAPKSQQLPTRR
jgi:outer membrane protein assembly factor BamA